MLRFYGIKWHKNYACLAGSAHRVFGPDLSIRLRAAVPLAKDDHISITYTDSLWPTKERRNYLMISKYFECICLRCLDPTELKVPFLTT